MSVTGESLIDMRGSSDSTIAVPAEDLDARADQPFIHHSNRAVFAEPQENAWRQQHFRAAQPGAQHALFFNLRERASLLDNLRAIDRDVAIEVVERARARRGNALR